MALCFSTVSCVKDTIWVSDEVSTKEFNVTGYSGLRVSSAFNAYVNFSDTKEEIIVKTNREIRNKVIVEKDGNYLRVKLKPNTFIRGNAKMDVYITTKSIRHFDASGAANIILDTELTTSNATIELTGASEFKGEINTDKLDMVSRGASSANVYGTVDQFNATFSGGSQFKDYDLLVKNLNIKLSGASDVRLSATETIDVTASGASKLRYKGNATITSEDISGASEVIQK